jgi:hypothetical protein
MPDSSYVQVIDLGMSTLDRDMERFCQDALRMAAQDVAGHMRANIQGYGTTAKFLDTGATANSVQVNAPDPLTREIGPSTDYAIYGELGWTQTKAWGHAIRAGAIVHAPIGFAKAALQSVAPSFVAAIQAAIRRLGRPG